MRKVVTVLCATLATVALVTAPLGCKPKQRVTSPTVRSHFAVSAYAKGHEITVDIDGGGGLLSEGGRTFVQLPGHEVDIEQERLLLDGKEVAKIPAAARLEIVLSGTTLSLNADGTTVSNLTIQR